MTQTNTRPIVISQCIHVCLATDSVVIMLSCLYTEHSTADASKYRDIINVKIHHRWRNNHSAETAACTSSIVKWECGVTLQCTVQRPNTTACCYRVDCLAGNNTLHCCKNCTTLAVQRSSSTNAYTCNTGLTQRHRTWMSINSGISCRWRLNVFCRPTLME